MIAGDRRRDRRVPTELPIQFGISEGRTRDLSATGVFFQTSEELSPEAALSFDLLLHEGAGAIALRASCAGRVVRVTPMGQAWGVAVTLDSFEI